MTITTATEAAARIIELRQEQNRKRVSADVRELLSTEERNLWDRFYSGLPLEAIEGIARYN